MHGSFLLHARHAAVVILAHNHPSGEVGPSSADLAVTQAPKSALALIDARVLDHIVVGESRGASRAERGLVRARPRRRVPGHEAIGVRTRL